MADRELSPAEVREIQAFHKKSLIEQQAVFAEGVGLGGAERQHGEKVIRAYFTAFKALHSVNKEIPEYLLLMLDGIYEDDRTRATLFAKIQRAYHDQEDIIGTLIK